MKNILVFIAHQDDETIGCGGTLRKFYEMGHNVIVSFVTDGSTGIDQSQEIGTETIVDTRLKESQRACKILGVTKIEQMKLRCQDVENSQKNFHKFIRLIRKYQPDIIITHYEKDKHRDHRATYEIVSEASWKASENIHAELGPPHKVGDVWCCEVTDLIDKPDIYVDITGCFDKKMEALTEYSSQSYVTGGIIDFLDGISKVRGFYAGVSRAEAFKSVSPFGRLYS